ncbi:MAG: DMT family transporter [Armatimonadetes bacterium]|nr:DMT family transporter [Armatimonadota bacterium]
MTSAPDISAPRSTVTPRTALLALLCMLLWSGAYVTGKIAIGTPDAPGFMPFRLAFFRFAVAGVLLFAWRFWHNRESLRIRREDYGAFFRIGLLGMCLTYVFNYGGLALSSGTAASLIMASEPVWIAVLAVIFLRERATVPRIVGIVLGLGGATLVVLSAKNSPNAGSGGQTALLGNALMVLSLLFEAGSVLTVKGLTKRYTGGVIVTYQFLIGALLLAPVAAWETMERGTLHPTGGAWGAFAYLLVACTLIAYPLWFRLLETTDASDLTLFIFLQPVIGAVFGVAILHEPFTAGAAIGAMMVLLGVWNLTVSGRRGEGKP